MALKVLVRAGNARKLAGTVVVVVASLLALSECLRQHLESEKIRVIAERVVAEAHATDRRSQVLALRDYVRATVTTKGAPFTDAQRPYLRATAYETLTTGLGYCGEDSRAFIVLADALGIRAARVNLYGAHDSHVAALTDVGDGVPVIVDAMNPPVVDGLEPLDHAMVGHSFVDYSTLNVRRLHLGWLFSRIKLRRGPLTFWGENPHALKALFWGSIALAVMAMRGARSMLRAFLHRRGWVHRSALEREGWRQPGSSPGSEATTGEGGSGRPSLRPVLLREPDLARVPDPVGLHPRGGLDRDSGV